MVQVEGIEHPQHKHQIIIAAINIIGQGLYILLARLCAVNFPEKMAVAFALIFQLLNKLPSFGIVNIDSSHHSNLTITGCNSLTSPKNNSHRS